MTVEEYQRLLFKNSFAGQLLTFLRGILALGFWAAAQASAALFLTIAVVAITNHAMTVALFGGMVLLSVVGCFLGYGTLRCSPSKGFTKLLAALNFIALGLMSLVTFIALGETLNSWWSAVGWMLLIIFLPGFALTLLALLVVGAAKLAKGGA